MRTSKQRLDAFKKDLSALLKKHDCYLEIEQKFCAQTINVYSCAYYDDHGNCIDELLDVNLGSEISQTSLDN